MSEALELITAIKPYVRQIYELGFSLVMLFLFLKVTGLWDRFAPAVLKGKSNGKDGKDKKESKGGISTDALAEQMHRRFDGANEAWEGLGRRLEQVKSQADRLPHLQSSVDKLTGRVEGMDQQLDELQNKVQEALEIAKWLKDVHNRTDPNGTYIWYVPRGVPEQLASMNGLLKELTGGLGSLSTELHELSSRSQ